MLFITHSGGRGYKDGSLYNWFKDCCKNAGVPNCHFHAARKGGAAKAAESGATENEIAAMLVHKGTRKAARYTKRANKNRLIDSAFEKLERAKSEPNVSRLPNRLEK